MYEHHCVLTNLKKIRKHTLNTAMHRHTETSSYTYVVGTNTHIIYIETIGTVLYTVVKY